METSGRIRGIYLQSGSLYTTNQNSSANMARSNDESSVMHDRVLHDISILVKEGLSMKRTNPEKSLRSNKRRRVSKTHSKHKQYKTNKALIRKNRKRRA